MADLIISEGDCEFYARCECGKQLGMTKPDQSFDVHGKAWERHVMTDCPIGPYDPEAGHDADNNQAAIEAALAGVTAAVQAPSGTPDKALLVWRAAAKVAALTGQPFRIEPPMSDRTAERLWGIRNA